MSVIVNSVLLVTIVKIVSSNYCKETESIDITNGTLTGGIMVYNGLMFNEDEWYESVIGNDTKILGCPCIRRTCLWKCCPENNLFENRSCVSTTDSFNPPIFHGTEISNVSAIENFFYMYNQLCEDRYLVDSALSSEDIYLQQNGTLYEKTSLSEIWHDPETYCLDYMTDGGTESRLIAAVCYPEVTEETSNYFDVAYGVGLCISVPFFLVTFLVYALIPELRNLHGMCLMAYCSGMIVAFVLLAYLKFNSGDVAVSMGGCITIAFIVYYAFQTSFFWMNAMCYDIWQTFRGYRSANSRGSTKSFIQYGIYAWGVPALLLCIVAIMQFSNIDNAIKPNFGVRKCWFSDWKSEVVYNFIPVMLLVVCNTTLFAITANRIRSIHQETAILKSSESRRSDRLKFDKQRYVLYLKLFMVMGVNWTLEIVSFFIGGTNWYWIITDLSNIGLGILIFMIFVWKKRVRKLVIKKIRSFRNAKESEFNPGLWITSTVPTDESRFSGNSSIILKELK